MPYEGCMLELMFGPMRSGKSTTLLTKSVHYTILKKKVGAFIPCISSVRDDPIEKYINIERRSVGIADEMGFVRLSDNDIKLMKEFDIILIDEGQFISNIYDVTLDLLAEGKHVYICSLSGDCHAALFGNVYQLIPHAKRISIITGDCSVAECKNESVYSVRVDTHHGLIDVNGNFQPMCTEHAAQYIGALKT